MSYGIGDSIIAFAPASVANVGPCYDIMGYCLDYVGDFVEVKLNSDKGELIFNEVKGPYSSDLKGISLHDNAAYAVADHIFNKYEKSDLPFGLELTLYKYMPVGSGMGSSAASGAAAGKALYEILGINSSTKEKCEELVIAEGVTSGTSHPDNVVPSFFGGFWIILNNCLKKIPFENKEKDKSLVSVIVKPDINVSTEKSRKKVREYIIDKYIGYPEPNPDPTGSASDLLALIKEQSSQSLKMLMAAQDNDIKKIGKILNQNEMLENARRDLIPNFKIVKNNAIDAGAYGCTISGSGPSVVAITSSYENNASKIKEAIIEGFQSDKLRDCKWLISPINNEGARLVHSIEEEVKRGEKNHLGEENHNFYEGVTNYDK